MSISVTSLGGAKEVGASCYLLEFGENSVLVDCGLRPSISKNDPDYLTKILPDLNLLKKAPVCLIVTHGHLDHAGAPPVFSRMFPDVPIYATRPTQSFMFMQWEDTISIAKYSHKEPIFSIGDAGLCQRNVHVLYIGKSKKLGNGISVKMFDAGHIPGAASLLFIYKGKTIFFTGDFSYQDQTAISGSNFGNTKADYVISESTYLNKTRPSFSFEKSRFIGDVFRILGRGGKVLIPSFSIGRSQEVFEILRSSGVTDQFDVWLDGSAKRTSIIHKFYLPDKIDPDIENHFVPDDDRGSCRRYIKKLESGPCVIIVPSGMMEGGHAVSCAQSWVDNNRNAILFPGYLQPDSLGYRVCHSSYGDQIDFPPMVIRKKGKEPKTILVSRKRHCEIQSYQFSAHASHEDLVGVWRGLNPQKLILVHGDSANIDWAIQNPNDILPGLEVFGPQNGEKVVLEP